MGLASSNWCTFLHSCSARNLPSRSARVAASKSLVSAMKEESESESGDGSDEEDAAMSDASEDYVPSGLGCLYHVFIEVR